MNWKNAHIDIWFERKKSQHRKDLRSGVNFFTFNYLMVFFTHQIFIEPKFCFFMLKKTIPIILSLNLTAQNGNVLFSHTRFCIDPQNICNLRVLCKDSLISASILTNK